MYFGKEITLDISNLEIEIDSGAIEDGIEDVLGKCKTYFNSVAAIAKNVETFIVQHTVAAGRRFIILGGTGSAMTDTIFRLYIDDVLFEVKRNAWTERNIDFQIKHKVTEGSVIKITGEHNSHLYNIGYVHDMEASLIGLDLPV